MIRSLAGRFSPLLATLVFAFNSASPQLVSLLFLGVEGFAHFSLAYLVFGLVSSTLLSVVAEAWARRPDNDADARGRYFGAAAAVSLAGAIISFGVVWFSFKGLATALLLSAATYSAGYWSAARYRAVVEGQWVRLARAECVGLFLGVLVWTLLLTSTAGGAGAVAAGWFSTSVAAIILGPVPAFASPWGIGEWIKDRALDIRALLTDSILLDLGAVGTPLILMPFLGTAGFAKYRAISNGAFPVRLALSAIRPALARLPRRRMISPMAAMVVIAVFALAGFGVGVAVYWLGAHLNSTGILGALREYYIEVGAFAAVTGMGQIWYMLCRIHNTGSQILTGRLAQTVLVTAMPIIGFVWGGEKGAIWGFVASAAVSAVVWLLIGSLHGRAHVNATAA